MTGKRVAELTGSREQEAAGAESGKSNQQYQTTVDLAHQEKFMSIMEKEAAALS